MLMRHIILNLMTSLGTHKIAFMMECTGLFKIWTRLFAREKTMQVPTKENKHFKKGAEYNWGCQVIAPTISSHSLYQRGFLSRLFHPHSMFQTFLHNPQPYITWLAFCHLWLRNTCGGTSMPAFKHWRKRVAYLKFVVLNKSSNLGIGTTRRVFHSTLNSENLEMKTSRGKILWNNLKKMWKLLNFHKANHLTKNFGRQIRFRIKFPKNWVNLTKLTFC